MATDTPSQGGRRHFHRGRRGHDRRAGDRRAPQAGMPPNEPAARQEHVDVEQIMRDIRAKIAQRHGIDLTDQQIQELAARRLESILDPRTIKPALLDQLRRAAGSRPERTSAADRVQPPFTFEDTTLYDSPSGAVRFMRRLLNPLLKLFFNPNPLIRALNIQARVNVEAARREAERDERQAEWNALQYELLQRVVSEIAKVSLEVQSLTLRVESLAAKVDFNERRVRGLEGMMQPPSRQRERERDAGPPPSPPPSPPSPAEPPEPAAAATAPGGSSEAPRRRRRRRRGRRAGSFAEAPAGLAPSAPEALEGEDDEIETETALTERESVLEAEPGAGDAAPAAALEPEPGPSAGARPTTTSDESPGTAPEAPPLDRDPAER